jgi:hypothetical protein
MGNAESQQSQESNQDQPPSQVSHSKNIPVQIKKPVCPIVSDSLVTGSPLFEQDSVSTSFQTMIRKKGNIGTESRNEVEYIQPPGERDYKNSAKIFHGYGPSGLAPLASLNTKKHKAIPIMVNWSQAGKVVHITGTFNDWQKKIRLRKRFHCTNTSVDDFSTIIDMPPGLHKVKFIVDDEWKCSEDLPFSYDQEGNLVNEIEVVDEDGKSMNDGLQDVTDEYSNEDCVQDSPLSSYDCKMPLPPPLDLNQQENFPPSLPVQLQKVLLNSKSISESDPYLLPIPNHVGVNHLYACSIRDGVMAIGSTFRYKKKYVTTVLYKPVQLH